MAIIKHIKSKNANYSASLEYLLFQHDEKTGKAICDNFGRIQLRKEYYMDGLNCDPMSFDKECVQTNHHFHKNRKTQEIKSHHYIISFDPSDVKINGLTGEKAQALCMEFAKKNFPGYQALIVTHTDGHNNSGNIHTHIVINSVRKHAVKRQQYMDKPHEHEAGFKHRSSNRFLKHLQKEVMCMCEKEGLHQIDLLSPATTKITQQEYMAQLSGQKKLDELNKQIIADGLNPATTIYQTQKQFLRNAIDECAPLARDFRSFQALLLEKYDISVIESKGRYRYLHPEREQRTTDKALGSHYGKQYLEQIFGNSEQVKTTTVNHSDTVKVEDCHRDPIMILYYKSQLRLVIDLQTNVKAMQSQAYERKIKISNLQQMAKTIIYVEENGFDSQSELTTKLVTEKEKLSETQKQIETITAEMKSINEMIHFTGQYLSNKKVYTEFVKSKNKKLFRQEHIEQINAYEEARDTLKNFYPDGNFLQLKYLKEQKAILQNQLDELKKEQKYHKDYCKDLEIADVNITAILDRKDTDKQKSHDIEL